MAQQEQIMFGDYISPYFPNPDASSIFGMPGTNLFGQGGYWPISQSLLSRHMMLLGAIGTGKSNATYHLIDNLRRTLTQNDIIFIFDTKGDFYHQFYRPGDVVIANDERATGGWGQDGRAPDYWNLFTELTIDGRTEENAMEVASAIFADQLEKTSQPFFPTAAMDLLRALLLHICRDQQSMPNGGNNALLLSALQSITPERMVSVLKRYKDLQSMIPYIADPKSGQTLGVMSELQQGIRKVLVGNFAKKGSLSMRDLVRRKGGRVVFVEYDLSIGSVLTPIYRLLFDLAIKEALSRKTNEGNVYFIIDEFRLLPKLTHIDDGVNFGRSLGAKFIIGVQNVQQVFHAYGEELGRSLLSGFSTTVSFRLNDPKSRQFVKDLYGRNGRMMIYSSSVGSKGVVEQFREGDVIQDHDLNNLRVGEALVCTNGSVPFNIRFTEFGK